MPTKNNDCVNGLKLNINCTNRKCLIHSTGGN